jgi:hypothetical protein
MHCRVSFNSYNINAQGNNTVMAVAKSKPYSGWYALVLALVRKKVRFLVLHNC